MKVEHARRSGVAFLAAVLSFACGSSPNGPPIETCPPFTKTMGLPTGANGPSAASSIEEVASFGENPGSLKMFVRAPSGGRASAIVVALHGCTQSAQDYVAAGWNAIADAKNIVVVYPQQASTNNSMRCFRWWDAAHAARDGGEAKSILAMVAHAKKTWATDTARSYVTGLSAGGAMAVALLASYPDVFDAGAIMAGLPYGCAKSQAETFSCMSGADKSADEWAALVPANALAMKPRISIWQGDADYIVRPTNKTQLVRQWTKIDGVAEEPSSTTTEGKARHAVHRDASGVVRVESWEISGMSHGVAVDPKASCGSTGAYALDVGLCATSKAAEFFGLGGSIKEEPAVPNSPNPCN
jgi:poly(hydroxyalkanoate) depolymerase family esterase